MRIIPTSAVVVVVLALSAVAIGKCDSFGDTPRGARLARAQQSPLWHDGQFKNPQPIWADTRAAWLHLMFGPPTSDVVPDTAIPVVHESVSAFATAPVSGLRVTWFGHSSALVEIDGTNVLIDPLWSQRASPVSWAGPKRWYPPPVALSALPKIDAVVISHDHYDHLDREVILALKSGHAVFVLPLGAGAHLLRWGIPDSRIVELDWWQSAQVGSIQVIATPARHKSGRTPMQANETLWAGYALVGADHRAWYSGDTGFHSELTRIGERLGPFDITLIDSGQYDPNWPDTHLGPELAVEANREVRGKAMMPVHWGLLKLANHAWTEPVERVLAAAHCRGVYVLTPRPGESIEPTRTPTTPRWWPQKPWQSAERQPVIATRNGASSDRVQIAPCERN